MEARALGVLLIIGGSIAVPVGWMIASGWMRWFGRLPGDLRIVSHETRIYVPFASMLLVSIVLTVVVSVVRRLS